MESYDQQGEQQNGAGVAVAGGVPQDEHNNRSESSGVEHRPSSTRSAWAMESAESEELDLAPSNPDDGVSDIQQTNNEKLHADASQHSSPQPFLYAKAVTPAGTEAGMESIGMVQHDLVHGHSSDSARQHELAKNDVVVENIDEQGSEQAHKSIDSVQDVKRSGSIGPGSGHRSLEADLPHPQSATRPPGVEDGASSARRAEARHAKDSFVHANKTLEQMCAESVHAAARYGDIANLRKLINRTTIDLKDKIGFTPLHFAACYGHDVAVDLLLGEGANTEAQNEVGWTPLHVAARNGHVECVRAIISASAKVDAADQSKWTALHSASCSTNAAVVEILLAAGASVGLQDADGWTPLHFAARFNNVEALERLLAAGASPDVQDVDGWTATHNSARNGRNKCVQILLQHKANLTLMTRYGETPLHVACRKGKARVVSEMVAHARAVGMLEKLEVIKDLDGRTPHDVAASEHIRSTLRGVENGTISQYDLTSDGSAPQGVLSRAASVRKLSSVAKARGLTCTLL